MLFSHPFRRTLILLSIVLVGLPLVAHANVGKVQEILEGAGQSGVARGPKTVSDEVKAKLGAMARELAGKTSARAYIVVLADGSNVDDYGKVYDRMKLGGADVLIVSAGSKWVLRCNAIAAADKQRLMKQVMSAGGNPLDRMARLTAALPAAIAASQQRAAPASSRRKAAPARPITTEPASSSGGFGFGFAFLVLLLVGGAGVVFWRRKSRDTRLAAEFKQALDPGEQAMANIFLGMDAVEGKPGFDALLSRATDLSSDFDALKAQPPSRQAISRATSLGQRAKALEGEFRALGGGSGPNLLG